MSSERRRFLKNTVAALATSHIVAGTAMMAKAVASERVRVGVMGAGGRALSLIQTFASNPEVDIVAIADVDESKFGPGVTAVAKLHGREPRIEKDFRRLIDDKTIDAIVIGTPDHWHAIPTILACQAGKDVYVEKPDSHNIVEGMRMVAAMRRHSRIVQMGSQHRSTIRLQSAMEFVQSGKLGKVHVAKAWESTKQGVIGFPKDSEPPSGVDYDMWIGPAQKRPFNVNRFHGKWRWLYDFGTGDLGNDGVHRLDMAVALLQSQPSVGRAWMFRKTHSQCSGWVLHLLVIERSKVLGQPDPHTWWRWLRQRINLPLQFMVVDLANPFWTALARSDLVAQFRSADEACFYRAREG